MGDMSGRQAVGMPVVGGGSGEAVGGTVQGFWWREGFETGPKPKLV